MQIAELVNSCSHESVAHAAVLSIGVDFARTVELAAERNGLSAGAYAADRVLAFAHSSDGRCWDDLARAMEGDDMPVLRGLRYILENSMRGEQRMRAGEVMDHRDRLQSRVRWTNPACLNSGSRI